MCKVAEAEVAQAHQENPHQAIEVEMAEMDLLLQ
jgi:hypothetical protein